ncbi:helix-hairpin-helix domain-containing protein [Bacillus dakarensis]|uniref:helix-hairpin-helix domain-containing protein n=1 Tax=Robertmurraya dakarensis TaxID=1926278 RepID=UPI000981AF8B|nr:helix-hairpin-helix domain-containing protein [Bacillus dakarensis]
MIQWMKEHKGYVLLGFILVVCILYYYFSTAGSAQLPEQEDTWTLEEETPIEELHKEPETEEIMVDVKGAVASPGVYIAEVGERVVDVIEKAGGLTETANAAVINFAMRVTDEMVLYVPEKGEELEIEGQANPVVSQGGGPQSDKINLNKATQAELETLPGIGPAKSQLILEYRDQNGSFKTIEDIMEISGFGEKTFEKLKDLITVQ